jgi:hypothetical protein
MKRPKLETQFFQMSLLSIMATVLALGTIGLAQSYWGGSTGAKPVISSHLFI